jgi:hypothetical protein
MPGSLGKSLDSGAADPMAIIWRLARVVPRHIRGRPARADDTLLRLAQMP